MSSSESKSTLDNLDKNSIPVTKELFNQRYKAWKEACNAPHMMISSDSRARTKCIEYQNLIALGPAIKPFVKEILQDPESVFAIRLYEDLDPVFKQRAENELGPFTSLQEIVKLLLKE